MGLAGMKPELAERSAMIERLASMPLAMRELPQWLLWRLEQDEGEPKARKVPYYVSGKRRLGKQGEARDRAALVGFDAAIARLGKAMQFSGLGFAFLPGDGLIGVDVDNAIDPATGEISALCNQVIELCDSYTERSPSGRGVHIIVAGETRTNKDDGIGLEVFCGSQYFTCTGAWCPGAPREVRSVNADALETVHELVNTAKRTRRKPAAGTPSSAGPDGFTGAQTSLVSWLEQALQVLDANCSYSEWIGIGMALKSALGDAGFGLWDYWSSKANKRYAGQHAVARHWQSFPGTDVDGAMVVFKMARKGNRWRPPDDFLAVYGGDGEKARIAARVNRKAPLRLVAASTVDERPAPPTPTDAELGIDATTPIRRGRSRRGANPPPEGDGVSLGRLCESFRLIYGTAAVWDGEQRITMDVSSLRLIFGHPAVKAWLASPERKVVQQADMVFEPGIEVGAHQVNLFDGLPMTPEPCEDADVGVMLELLRHLCSMTATATQTVESVMDFVLSWLAYPLQHVGAKMRCALVFHGPQGAGKNLFFDCIRSMYGKYGRMVGQTELDDKFNDWLSAKLLIIGNEVVTRQELFHNKNKLKWIVTEDEIPIRGMHQTVRWESNHAQVIFISNEHQPVVVEKDDRRHLVVYTPAAGDSDLYLRVSDFLARGGGAKFMHYLMRYDTQGFNEHTKPIMTEAKAALIELSLKPGERFINEWLSGLIELPVHVCSAEQLFRVFRRWCDLTGERWPGSQAQFTLTAQRHAVERTQKDPATGGPLPPRLVFKVVQLKAEVGPRKSVRCWIPRGCAPPAGVTEGEWAAQAVKDFELTAARFGRRLVEEDID